MHRAQEDSTHAGDPHVRERATEGERADQRRYEKCEDDSGEGAVDRLGIEQLIELNGGLLRADLVVDDAAVDLVNLMEASESEATAAFDKVRLGRPCFLVAE